MPLSSNLLLQEIPTIEQIGDAACYFPLQNGRYEVKPGLMPLSTDLGNGPLDQQVFQIDRSYSQFRQIKELARQERLDKYYQTHHFLAEVATAMNRLILDRLLQDYPQHFQFQPTASGSGKLTCQLSQEVLILDHQLQLQEVRSPALSCPYRSTLDALAMQVQEDLAIVCRSPEQGDWLSAIHLCYPNHWAAEDKIGKNFATVHAPVAHMESMNRQATRLVHTLITRQPMVRFAWGLSTDTRLNHHPIPPTHITAPDWTGRSFDPTQPRLYLRIERQVIWGLPEHNAALFTIRTYFRDCQVLKQHPLLQQQLISAIASMSPESLRYKGLAEHQTSILNWLQTSCNSFMPS